MNGNNIYAVQSRAVILDFPKRPMPPRRGRPKSARTGKDTGTPELVMKRLLGETSETLDLCLERGIISQPQHWCGVHMRWLYTLRNGAPGVRAIDLTHTGGVDIAEDDPEWRKQREEEYYEAVKTLERTGALKLVLNICVHNDRPAFLRRPLAEAKKMSKTETEKAAEFIMRLRDGLDMLAALWKRN